MKKFFVMLLLFGFAAPAMALDLQNCTMLVKALNGQWFCKASTAPQKSQKRTDCEWFNNQWICGREKPAVYWYYCGSTKKYYPYVTSCKEGWQKVDPKTVSQR